MLRKLWTAPGPFQVNSLHAQAIDRLAEGLAVEALASDGTIEAVSVENAPGFALALQWHPEWRVLENPHHAGCSPRLARPVGRGREFVMSDMERWLRERRVTEVECLVADVNGIARGKILPTEKFLRSHREDTLRLPEMIFVQTVTGDYPEDDRVTDPAVRDVRMRPDPRSLRLVPWYEEPTAQVISDCYPPRRQHRVDRAAPGAARDYRCVRRARLAARGRAGARVLPDQGQRGSRLSARAADRPLAAAESARQSYGIDAVNEFDPIFEDVYHWCELQEIDIDTLTHESGAAQMEINFNHGDPLELADQAFLFKRTLRQAALKHGIYATFMAKPMEREPGSAMHVHQSVFDSASGENLFARQDDGFSDLFLWHIGGLQKYLPAAMPLLAPTSIRTGACAATRRADQPALGLGEPHRGLSRARLDRRRAPRGEPGGRRRRQSVPRDRRIARLRSARHDRPDRADQADRGSAYRLAQTLPRHLMDALDQLRRTKPLQLFGDDFVEALIMVKETELEAYQRVISSWEREHLLLNV